MNKIKLLDYDKYYIELFIAIMFFVVAIATNSMILIIVNLLYFIIVLEIVRAVIGFLREQKVKIYLLIDAFIILTLREFIVNVVKVNKENISSIEQLLSNGTIFHILIFSGVLIFLFILRWLSTFTSPNKNKIKG